MMSRESMVLNKKRSKLQWPHHNCPNKRQTRTWKLYFQCKHRHGTVGIKRTLNGHSNSDDPI
eukprot:76689-Amphidinium_carterae.1